jgi:MFS family permease
LLLRVEHGYAVSEYLIEKVGHIRSFIFFGILFSIATVANKFFISIPGWMFFRLISGACLAALYVVIESYYLLISPSEKRGKIISSLGISKRNTETPFSQGSNRTDQC